MIKARQDGVLLFVLAGAIFLAAGFIMLRDSATPDFKGIYYAACCIAATPTTRTTFVGTTMPRLGNARLIHQTPAIFRS